MLLVPTYVAPSKIHGIGCFAAIDIKEGTMVWKLDPNLDRVWTEAEYNRLPQAYIDQIESYVYTDIVHGNFIYCVDNARFINHSDADPNLYEPVSNDRDIALRDITAHEELTIDYFQFCREGTTNFL